MAQFASRIFIDGGDPAETKQADKMLKDAGYKGLDGQTTNPSLIAKRSMDRKQNNNSTKQQKVTEQEAFAFYKKTVQEMSKIIPDGEISIQVIGDPKTFTTEEMLTQARDRMLWIPNGVIKFPTTTEGLAAAEVFCQEGPVNMTLNFSQDQAAAAYAATQHATHPVYISPFVGRLDDKEQNGMDVVVNEIEMYKGLGDGHVKVLAASVRSVHHILYALFIKCPVITIPFKTFLEWKESGFPTPAEDFIYDASTLTQITYKELPLDNDWKTYDIQHDLTDAGLARFWEDWKSIVE